VFDFMICLERLGSHGNIGKEGLLCGKPRVEISQKVSRTGMRGERVEVKLREAHSVAHEQRLLVYP
jgi:uncharacterized protein (DUF111 family)